LNTTGLQHSLANYVDFRFNNTEATVAVWMRK